MLEPVCIDASLIVAMTWHEPPTNQVNMLWTRWADEGRCLVAPAVLPFEVAGVLEHKVRSGALSKTVARLSIVVAESLMARVEQPEITGGLRTTWDLAERYGLRILDACYFAIARQEDAELWTLDRELAKRAGGKMP